ncbi:hypothetical protein [Clostridium transplantifaecale]|nr:hypothetical protein [Clostridium transplantifaecale]
MSNVYFLHDGKTQGIPRNYPQRPSKGGSKTGGSTKNNGSQKDNTK